MSTALASRCLTFCIDISAPVTYSQSMDTQDTVTITATSISDIAPDQQDEIANSECADWQAYRWTQGDDHGTAIYSPSIGRGGVCTNGNSIWVDADSIEQSIERAQSDDAERYN